jgi:hypothetical protein
LDEKSSAIRNDRSRPATVDDIRSDKPILPNVKRVLPTDGKRRLHSQLVKKLTLSQEYQKILTVLFENGIGVVSRMFSSEYNEVVASVFRKNQLSYLSTDYALESMNLGHISHVIILSSISLKDLRQLLGRMNRPNNGTFLQMLDDGKLVLVCFDKEVKELMSGSSTLLASHDFSSLSAIGSQLNVREHVDSIVSILRVVFGPNADQVFPIRFQELVERIFSASFFRAFHPEMCLTDKNMLVRDFAFVLLKCINSSTTSVSMKQTVLQYFGIDSQEVCNFLDGCCAHLMPVLVSTTSVSGFLGGETVEDLSSMIARLSEISSVLEMCLSVLSMTTKAYVAGNLPYKQKMNVVATLLSMTFDHLRKLISILDSKRATITGNLLKDGMKIGAVLCKKDVEQVASIFAGIAGSVLVELSNCSMDFDKLLQMVQGFIDANPQSSICEKASMFLKALQDLENHRATYLLEKSNLSSSYVSLCEARDAGMALKTCAEILRQVVKNSKGAQFSLVDLLNKLKPDSSGYVYLGIPDLFKKESFNFVKEINDFYKELSETMVRAKLLQEGQCLPPNQDGKIPIASLDALKRAVEIIKTADISTEDARLAELTVKIDNVQQEMHILDTDFELKINSLRHFTKMA